MCTPAVVTTIMHSVCRKCGTIGKSNKVSCCARGGSWFKDCGSAANVKLRHTWHEGIQACTIRAQKSKVAFGHRPECYEGTGDAPTDAVATNVGIVVTRMATVATTTISPPTSKAVIASANSPRPHQSRIIVLAPMADGSPAMFTPAAQSAGAPITARGYERLQQLYGAVARMSLLTIIALPN